MNSAAGQVPEQVPHCRQSLIGLPCVAYIRFAISLLKDSSISMNSPPFISELSTFSLLPGAAARLPFPAEISAPPVFQPVHRSRRNGGERIGRGREKRSAPEYL